MKELNEYRAHLLNKLVASAKEFREVCLAVKEPFAPLEEGGWNVHQIAAHTRDVDQLVYGLRAKRTAKEDNPKFQNFDSDGYAREHYSSDESLDVILNGFMQNIEELVAMLRKFSPETWSRVSRHEKLGSGLTLQLWVERGLAHIQEHLETVRKAK